MNVNGWMDGLWMWMDAVTAESNRPDRVEQNRIEKFSFLCEIASVVSVITCSQHNGNVDEAIFGIANKTRSHTRRVKDMHSGDINLLIIFNWIFFIAKRNHCKTTAAADGSEDGNGEKKEIEIAASW